MLKYTIKHNKEIPKFIQRSGKGKPYMSLNLLDKTEGGCRHPHMGEAASITIHNMYHV